MDSVKTTLIHDLTPSQLSRLLPESSGYTVIDANHKAAFCQGCFGCWLKSPGQCVIKDSLQTVSTEIGCSQQVIIFSRCCYGGFSPAVKRVLDRSIAVSLPFSPTAAGVSTIRCATGTIPNSLSAFMAPPRNLNTKRPRGWSMPTESTWAFRRCGYPLRKARSKSRR